MNLLLDTHTFLWFCNASPQISEKARNLIEAPQNQSFLSVASLWEIAIKVSIKKLRLQKPFEILIPQQLQENGYALMDIKQPHLNTLIRLPFHHCDPFDRLLIAQALSENVPILSADLTFDQYVVERIW